MKYYVVADVHGFYTELISALTEKGFFDDKEPHKLIVCGDLFDRGEEAVKLQDFILELMSKDEVILIRGNHEDLLVDFLNKIELWLSARVLLSHHYSNGTIDTVLQLTGMTLQQAIDNPHECLERMNQTPLIKTILPAMINYFETEKYIFVHGWIPCQIYGKGNRLDDLFMYQKAWRNSNESQWKASRWINGMIAASKGITVKNKTIVCGHWHCSFGHEVLEGKGVDGATDYSPYYGKGVIGIDTCTVRSRKINCLVIED